MTDKRTAADLEPGQVFITDTTSLTKEKITSFAGQYDPQPFHLDAEAAKGTFFKTLVASGWHVLAETMRLMVDARPFGATPLIGAEINNIRFRGPVLPDTRIRVRATVEKISSGRNPSHAFAHLLLETLDAETDETLVSQNWKVLVPNEPAST